jgi:serine/threonine-protein kinase
MAEPATHTPTGLVLGRYRPLHPLGSGGSGSVWLAHDERAGRDVALKIVPRTGTAGARAEREAAAAAQLDHPVCQRVYSLGRDTGHVYIAYEYVPGHTLRDALEQRELDDDDALEAAAQILEGLAHAHAHGIVHRDVKPANVLLVDAPAVEIRLLDFGLALLTEGETLTAVGDVPGTLAYISPERLKGRTAGPPTDVWSVGVLLWEALAGRHPFGNGRFLDVARRIEKGPPSLAVVRPDLPKGVVALVDRALSVDPQRRPAAAKLAGALRRSAVQREPRAQPTVALRLPASLRLPPALPRLATAAPAALLAGWTSARLPFFPEHWSALLALAAGVLAATVPRAGLAFALAVPILPLGNLSAGVATVYAAVALAWLFLFWARPRVGLVFVAGPLLAPLAALGLVPLAAIVAGGPVRRAAAALGAVAAAACAAAVGGGTVPLLDLPLPRVALAGLATPFAAAGALWHALETQRPLLLLGVVLAAAAVGLPYVRRRGTWAAAGFAAALLGACVAAAPGASPWPFVLSAWLLAAILVADDRHARRA